MTPALISIVVPAYNEAENLPELYRRVGALPWPKEIRMELLIIDDGSEDGSAAWLQAASARDSRVRYIRLPKNRGQQMAIATGLLNSQGDAVVVMDADLQYPPELIPEMIKHWQAGCTIVATKRRNYNTHPWPRRFLSWFFYRFYNTVSPVKLYKDMADFYLLDRKAVQRINNYPLRRRFHRGLVSTLNMPTTVLEFTQNPRWRGQPKYSLLRSANLALSAFGGLFYWR